jgi:hypothetical protein
LADARDAILLRERAATEAALTGYRLSSLLRRVTSRTVVDQWVTSGGLASQYQSTHGGVASCNLELVRAGRDLLVVGRDWDEAYFRAAELVGRNPMLEEEAETED